MKLHQIKYNDCFVINHVPYIRGISVNGGYWSRMLRGKSRGVTYHEYKSEVKPFFRVRDKS